MSFIILGRSKKGETYVLDTEDLVTDTLTEGELKGVVGLGFKLVVASKENLNIGIISDKNNYQVYINGCNTPIFSGQFPEHNYRNDLFAYEIKLASCGIVSGKLVIAIVCNCWCKYDIEVPMVMCHVISSGVADVRNMQYACKTDKPVYFAHKSMLKNQYEECHGDFPTKSLDTKYCTISVTSKGLSVFGVDYGKDIPVYDSLDNKLKFNIIEDV